MPDADGCQLLERIKSEERWRDLPVLMLSAQPPEEASVRSLGLGARTSSASRSSEGAAGARAGAAARRARCCAATRQALVRTEEALLARAAGRRQPPQARGHPARGHRRPLGRPSCFTCSCGARRARSACRTARWCWRVRATSRRWWWPRTRTRSCTSCTIQLDRYPELRAALRDGPAGARGGHRHASAVRGRARSVGHRGHRGADPLA